MQYHCIINSLKRSYVSLKMEINLFVENIIRSFSNKIKDEGCLNGE